MTLYYMYGRCTWQRWHFQVHLQRLRSNGHRNLVNSTSAEPLKGFQTKLKQILSTVGATNRAYERSGRQNRAGRKSGQASGAWSGCGRKWWSGIGARSGRSRIGDEAGSGAYRNKFECGAAFSPVALRSHAVTTNWSGFQYHGFKGQGHRNVFRQKPSADGSPLKTINTDNSSTCTVKMLS